MIYCPYCEAKGKTELVHFCGISKKNVGTESTYSFGKGIAGTVLLGPVGAVAGINGKKKNVVKSVSTYMCYGCGAKFEE